MWCSTIISIILNPTEIVILTLHASVYSQCSEIKEIIMICERRQAASVLPVPTLFFYLPFIAVVGSSSCFLTTDNTSTRLLFLLVLLALLTFLFVCLVSLLLAPLVRQLPLFIIVCSVWLKERCKVHTTRRQYWVCYHKVYSTNFKTFMINRYCKSFSSCSHTRALVWVKWILLEKLKTKGCNSQSHKCAINPMNIISMCCININSDPLKCRHPCLSNSGPIHVCLNIGQYMCETQNQGLLDPYATSLI